MYCGSCLHDNAIAKAMIRLGHDALLVPTYTPILTDETSAASEKLFLGGLNVYLQQMSPVFRWMPKWMDGFLSSPRLVNWIASRSMGTSADKLGGMTVSMLKGADGHQRKEVHRLCEWLETESPDIIVFSNLLIAGCIDELKSRLRCPVVVILQGDDIFYNGLTEPFKSQSLVELRRLAQEVDGFLLHSDDYRQRMARMLEVSPERMSLSPLSIDTSDYVDLPKRTSAPPTIGYLARLAPEKGLHTLVDAFIDLASRPDCSNVRLSIAGWLGPQHQEYWNGLVAKLAAAGLEDRYSYAGSVSRNGKLGFLSSIDMLCVPTTYQEPKGLFVLEGLAAGVPYILPSHGSFPEMHHRHDAGYLFAPNSHAELVKRLESCVQDVEDLRRMGAAARARLLDSSTAEGTMIEQEAKVWLGIFENLLPPASSSQST